MRKFSFQQQVLTGFVATLFFVFLLAVVSYFNIKEVEKNDRLRESGELTVWLARNIQQSLVDAETSVRGYVITGMPKFLERYHYSITDVNPSIQELKARVSGNIIQANNLDSLSYYSALKLEEMKAVVQTYNNKGAGAATELVRTTRGKMLMDKIRICIHEVEQLQNSILVERKAHASNSVMRTKVIVLFGSAFILSLVIVLFIYIKRTFQRQKLIEENANLTNAELEKITLENERQNWLLEGAVIVDAAMRGAQTLNERCQCLINEIARHVDSSIGLIYVMSATSRALELKGTFGVSKEGAREVVSTEEGFIGKAITLKKGILIEGVPETYFKIGSGLGYTVPVAIFVQPIFQNDQLKGIIELAFVDKVNPNTDEFLSKVIYSIGVALGAAEARVKMLDLVEKTKQQAEELELQHLKIQTANEELLQKANLLQASEDELRAQQQELHRANIELQKISSENEKQNWILVGANAISEAVRIEHRSVVFNVKNLANAVLNELSRYTGACVGSIYLADEAGKKLKYTGGYAHQPAESHSLEFVLGEGMIGQAALDGQLIILKEIPEEHIRIISGLGESKPRAVLIQPLYAFGKLKGVIELGFPTEVPQSVLDFIQWIKEVLAVEISTAQAKVDNQELFEKTQLQAEELESQHEELRTTNEELIRKTQLLQASEEELMVQQEELRQTNAELEEKAGLLEERNRAIEQAREAMAIKARELELSSKYKSEFLANMSHELRTPLNSILILARILKENKLANLSQEQVKYAGVIHTAGTDLLNLINDILDLSKIESGKIELQFEEIDQSEIKADLESLFREVANTKRIQFEYLISSEVPKSFVSDRQRVEQIIKNLLSNAFKFTSQDGKVSVEVTLAKGFVFGPEKLVAAEKGILAFTVKDNGIGIPADKQKAIFEAFQQEDGTTSRKYGGTGLGLSICRELSTLLGGEIRVESELNAGSTFTFYLPLEAIDSAAEQGGAATNTHIMPAFGSAAVMNREPEELSGTVELLNREKEYSVLIVEDDPNFAEILKDYARQRGLIPLHAPDGNSGLDMAKRTIPDAIVLDIMLPGMDGWAVLKRLKEDPDTSRIPVHLMSANEETGSKMRLEGAIGFLRKPVEKEALDSAFDALIRGSGKARIKRVLLVEDQRIQSDILTTQLKSEGVEVKQAFDGEETLQILAGDKDFDSIILDLKLPDMSGLDLLERIKQNSELNQIPVVINTAMELDEDSMARVMKYTHAMVLKSSKSNDRLLDEINLFMNKIKTSEIVPVSPGDTKQYVTSTTTIEKTLKNKTLLLVDDDMRNIFALSSALQGYDLNIEVAGNGQEALNKLEEKPDIDLVLMDIMMPGMDGYQAMLEIRKQSRFKKLPIIALTAKAMKNDREKTIESGANDYISKPVDTDKLVSMIRVWLS